MENMVHHGECLEPASGPIDRGTCPEGRCFFQSGTISLTTELFLPSHPRTPQFDQGQSILLPTTAHQEHHQVHSQRDGTYTVQRLLRDWTSLPDLSIQPTHRTRDMDRRPSSQNRCHTDLLLVAAQRHRSSSSDNITCLAPDDSHRTDNIPDLASPENRLSRCLCRSRALLHLPISPLTMPAGWHFADGITEHPFTANRWPNPRNITAPSANTWPTSKRSTWTPRTTAERP